MTLHLLQSADSLQRALPTIAAGDSLVFIGIAQQQIHLLNSKPSLLPQTVARYSLSTTGKLDTLENVTPLGYPELVTLSSQHQHCLSW